MTTKRIDNKENNIFKVFENDKKNTIENEIPVKKSKKKSVTFLMENNDFKALCDYFKVLKLKQGEGIRFALGFFLRNYNSKGKMEI